MNQGCNEQRFIALYNSYVGEIYKFIFLRIGLDKAIAEDIAQEVFLDAYKGISRFKGLCTEKTWLFRIARNKVYDYYRKHYKESNNMCPADVSNLEQLSDPGQDIGNIMEQSLNSGFVFESLNRLPQQYKIILVLKYIDGRSVKEIASITGKSAKSVDNILYRARVSLLKHYRSIQEEAY